MAWRGFHSMVVLAAISVVAATMVACDEGTTPPPASCDSPALAVIAASDYSLSQIVVLRSGADMAPPISGTDLGGDPVLSVSQGRCFFVVRDHDLLVELDPTCGAPIRKIATGDGVTSDNPQDVAATSDGSLFVPKYRTGDLLVLRPSGAREVVHLASFDPDGNPQPSSATTVVTDGQEKIWVTLERLNGALQPSGLPSLVIRVDAKTLAIDGQVTLAGQDPFGLAVPFGGGLFYAEPGRFDAITETNAGVERLDPATMTSALVVREKDLGGSVSQVAVTDGCAAAIVADATKDINATSLVTFDPVTGKVHTTAGNSILKTPGYDLEGLAFTQGVLYVGDRRRAETGYPIHAFSVGPACVLSPRPDTLFSPQKPVAIRSPR